MPGRDGPDVAALRTTVSPYWHSTALVACLANWPVSKDNTESPICFSTRIFTTISILNHNDTTKREPLERMGYSQKPKKEKRNGNDGRTRVTCPQFQKPKNNNSISIHQPQDQSNNHKLQNKLQRQSRPNLASFGHHADLRNPNLSDRINDRTTFSHTTYQKS